MNLMRSCTIGLLACLLTLVIGCGGGGGGGGGSTSLIAATLGGCPVAGVSVNISYSTDWGAAPATASQLLELVGSDGSVIRTDVLNKSAGNTLTLSGVTSATYLLRTSLYSTANATGTKLSVAQQAVNLCSLSSGGTISVFTSNSLPPTATYVSLAGPLLVTSGGVQVTKGLKLVVYPTILNGISAIFTDPTKVTYTVNGGIGSVDTSANFLAITPGAGSIVASYPAVTAKAATALTVTDSAPKSTWTFLVYMNAANDLDSFSTLNFNQMEVAAGVPGNARIVVQWKQSTALFPSSTFDGTRRYLVTLDNSSAINSQVLQSNMTEPDGSPLDMGKATNLFNFVTWGKANYPADHTCLVIWNHGNGWRRGVPQDQPTRGFSYDDQSRNNIQTWEIPQALGSQHFDIIAWDCSLMQMSEVAYELRNNATYVVGSEESPPGEGYPYDTIIGAFRDNPTASVETLAHAFVDKTLAVPAYTSRNIEQSVVKTANLPALITSLNTLSQGLFADAANLGTTATNIRQNGQVYSFATDFRYYYDLVDVCTRLEADTTVPAGIKTSSADVRAKLGAAVVYEGHNANSPGSHGLSVDWSPSGYFATVKADYDLLDFSKDTAWSAWLAAQPQ